MSEVADAAIEQYAVRVRRLAREFEFGAPLLPLRPGRSSAGCRGTRAGGRGSVPGSADETGTAGYRPLRFSIARGMTGSAGDAEDLVQDAFFGLTRARQAGTAIADPGVPDNGGDAAGNRAGV